MSCGQNENFIHFQRQHISKDGFEYCKSLYVPQKGLQKQIILYTVEISDTELSSSHGLTLPQKLFCILFGKDVSRVVLISTTRVFWFGLDDPTSSCCLLLDMQQTIICIGNLTLSSSGKRGLLFLSKNGKIMLYTTGLNPTILTLSLSYSIESAFLNRNVLFYANKQGIFKAVIDPSNESTFVESVHISEYYVNELSLVRQRKSGK